MPKRASDLRAHCPPVYDQKHLNACSANAIAAALWMDERRRVPTSPSPSRLFIYYNERAIEGTVPIDAGAMIRDGIKSVASDGVCPEPEWPYDIAKFSRKPTAKCYADAKLDRAISYQSLIQDLNQMKGCLASGYPFVFGFTVYESFESEAVKASGHAPMPKSSERPVGGHAVMAVGYVESKQWFLVRNSWGAAWGMKGYFTMPYAYFIQPGLARDFWTIRLVG